MKGWLIINGFLKAESFEQIYSLLLSSFQKRGVELEIKKSTELFCALSENFKKPDFVLFWDKDIYLSRRLENEGIRLFNSSSAIEKSDNKALTALYLQKNRLPIPKTYISPKTFENIGYSTEFLSSAFENLGFPIIIKEVFGSFGKQVYLAKNKGEAENIIKNLGYKDFILQEYIAESHGRDLRINVVGGRVVSAMMRQNKNDFRSNVGSGGSAEKIEITKTQENLALSAAAALGLDFAGVDLLFSKNGEAVCEVNSNPHFLEAKKVCGVDLSEEIVDYIISQIKNGR